MRIAFIGYVLIYCFCLSSTAGAETLNLVSGQKVQGQIILQNEMHVIVDVQGVPRTFFWGEIDSIDGKKVDLPVTTPPPEPEPAPGLAVAQGGKIVSIPYFNDEQDSLIRFMSVRKSAAPVQNPVVKAAQIPIVQHISVPPMQKPVPAEKTTAAPLPAAENTDKTQDSNKNVIPTPDGGIIVVSHDKLIKFDKNLRLIKEINLNAPDAAVSSH